MSLKDKIEEYCMELPEGIHNIYFADGFDDAVIGYDKKNNRVVYSEDQVLEILQYEEEMTEEDALEHYYYNIKGSYLGPGTPVFIREVELD